jgi:hypothetical protein
VLRCCDVQPCAISTGSMVPWGPMRSQVGKMESFCTMGRNGLGKSEDYNYNGETEWPKELS